MGPFHRKSKKNILPFCLCSMQHIQELLCFYLIFPQAGLARSKIHIQKTSKCSVLLQVQNDLRPVQIILDRSKFFWIGSKQDFNGFNSNQCTEVRFACFLSGGFTNMVVINIQRVIRRESKTDSYSKDLLFLACVSCCVITFEPIMIQTCSAPHGLKMTIWSSVL